MMIDPPLCGPAVVNADGERHCLSGAAQTVAVASALTVVLHHGETTWVPTGLWAYFGADIMVAGQWYTPWFEICNAAILPAGEFSAFGDDDDDDLHTGGVEYAFDAAGQLMACVTNDAGCDLEVAAGALLGYPTLRIRYWPQGTVRVHQMCG